MKIKLCEINCWNQHTILIGWRASNKLGNFLTLYQEQTEVTSSEEIIVASQAQPANQKPPGPLQATNEEPEAAQDVEIPPPMAIQDHTFASQQPSQEDLHAKLVSSYASIRRLTKMSKRVFARWHCFIANGEIKPVYQATTFNHLNYDFGVGKSRKHMNIRVDEDRENMEAKCLWTKEEHLNRRKSRERERYHLCWQFMVRLINYSQQ